MKCVLITGASSGIGWATAQFLVEKGYRVFGTTRSLQKRSSVVKEANDRYGDRFQFIEMDIELRDSVRSGVDSVVKKAGGIDALICNAGNLLFGSIEEMPEDLLIKQFNVNVFGHLRTIQAALPYMREKRSGNIILISSIAGSLVIPYQVHYSASKYAVEAFTEGLRQELHGFGIKVSAIRPGYIKTEFDAGAIKHVPGNSPYKKWSDIMWVEITKLAQKALPTITVAEQVYRILKKRNPKSFYTVASFVESLGPFLAPVLPSAVKEKFIRMFYRING